MVFFAGDCAGLDVCRLDSNRLTFGRHDEVSFRRIARVRVLVTGASGFIGSRLVPDLLAQGHHVVAASRRRITCDQIEWRPAPDLGPRADWSAMLRDIDVVVHLAGMAHVTKEAGRREQLFRKVNVEGTRQLARQSARAGVKQLIFAGSCHAVAAESDEILTATTPPRPESAYGRSKLDAEHAMQAELEGTSHAWTILRMPLVYGRGNKANFARLAGIVRSGVPLPLAGVPNRRSFLGVSNLTDFIARRCLGNPASYGRIYYPADEMDLSTADLVRLLAEVSGRRARLFKVPAALLEFLGRLPGFQPLRKLTRSLFVDSLTARRELQWSPPHPTRDLLAGSFRMA